MQVQPEYMLPKSLSEFYRAKQNQGAGFSVWSPSSPTSGIQSHAQGQPCKSHCSQKSSLPKASDPPEVNRDDADLDPEVKPNLQPNLIIIMESNINMKDQVPAWAETHTKRYQIPSVLRRITCFRNIREQGNLPSLAVTNIRSLGPKIQNFIQDLKLREITVALVTETWGKDDCKKYCHKILTMLELDGLGSVILNRKSRKVGGSL